MEVNIIYLEQCLSGLKKLPENSVDCSISSPPYWGLRDYGAEGQLGQEADFKEFVAKLIDIYSEIYRVLKPTGTCFVNLGDTFNTVSGRAVQLANGKTPEETMYSSKTGKKKKQALGGLTKNVRDIGNKSLLMIPERFALGMIDNGWILRNQIIWHKPNQMPQSATDRFTVDFEKIFFFVKQSTGYYFEQQLEPAIGYDGRKDTEYKGGNKDVSIGKHTRWKSKNVQEKGQQPNTMHVKRELGIPDEVYFERNVRTVWSINTKPYSEAHFATYPEKLVERMIKAGCPENGIVLDPFMGAGTTGLVARKLNRNYIGFEINSEYKKLAENRIHAEIGLFL